MNLTQVMIKTSKTRNRRQVPKLIKDIYEHLRLTSYSVVKCPMSFSPDQGPASISALPLPFTTAMEGLASSIR